MSQPFELFNDRSEILQAQESLETRQKLADFLKLLDNPEIKAQAKRAGIDTELLEESVKAAEAMKIQANNTSNQQIPNPFAANQAQTQAPQPSNLFFNQGQAQQSNNSDPTNTNNNPSK